MLRNPDRMVEVEGAKTVLDLLKNLEIVPETVLVIREATLLTRDESIGPSDELEIRPVLSGDDGATVVACSRCGGPTVVWGDGSAKALCSFCKTKALVHRPKEAGAPSTRARRSRRDR